MRRLLVAGLMLFTLSVPAQAANQFTDIACETSATSGTGTLNLAGAATSGYLGFLAAGITSGNSVPYTLVNGTGVSRKLETGWGTFTDGAPDTLTRVADWSTDGAGAELTLSGTSTVCVGPIASLFTSGAGYQINADFLDGVSSAAFVQTTRLLTGGTGIAAIGDLSADRTITLDLTELSTATFGAGTFTTLTFDAGATDPVLTAGSATLSITNAAVSFDTAPRPTANDGAALGVTGTRWADLFLADGSVIDLGTTSSRATITHVAASDSLNIAADPDNATASSQIALQVDGSTEATLNSTNFSPGTNDGNALGVSGTAWADLFLAAGGLIEFDGGTTNTFTCTGGNCTIEGNGLYRAGGTDVAVADGGTGASSLTDLITLTTHTSGVYVAQVADGTGVDGSCNAETCTYTPTLDLTEVSSATFGAGAFTTLTFDAGATDPVWTYASNAVSLTAAAEFKLGSTTTVAQDDYASTALTPAYQISGTTAATGAAGIITFAASATTPSSLNLGHAAGASVGTFTAVSSGDDLAVINFTGADGTNNEPAASILVEVDAATGANDMPGRMTFSTTADAAATPTARATFDSAGNFFPATNDGVVLGKSGNAWADLWLASGGTIEWSGGTTNTMTCAAGDCTIEGNGFYRAGGTDVAVADGGTGASSLTNLITLATHTTGSYVEQVADGTGIDGTANAEQATYTPTLDLTEVSSATWGAGAFTTFTFDAGATDPTLTFGSGTATLEAIFNVRQADASNAGGTVRFLEDPGTGSNYKSFLAPASITADTVCTLEDDASFIPDSCVGDGTDAGGSQTPWTSNVDAATFYLTDTTPTLEPRLSLNGENTITMSAVDAGAAGLGLVLDHDSASPAASDVVGSVTFRGNDAGANNTDYATIAARIEDTTDGTEDGRLTLTVQGNGVGLNALILDGNGTALLDGYTDVAYFDLRNTNTPAMHLYTSNANANGPALQFQHDSATPAADDVPADIRVYAGADDEEVGRLAYHLIDGATTTEDGDWRFYTDVAGASALQASIGNGVIIGTGTTFQGAETLWVNGKIITGTTSGGHTFPTVDGFSATAPAVEVIDGNANGATIGIGRYTNSSYGGFLVFAKSRAVAGAEGVVSADDHLGVITFNGSDGTDQASGASIKARVDGTPGNDDMPGRFEFWTSPDGSGTPVNRMTIKSDGTVIVGAGTIAAGDNVLALQDTAVVPLRFYENSGTGSDYIGFIAPTSITASVTCTFENDANPIPDSCVGDGTDGGGGLSDADYGDITVSSSGAVWNIDPDAVISGATPIITVEGTDAGAVGPILKLQHNSASAADGDIAADIQVFAGADDEEVGRIALEVDDGATTTEDTQWRFFNDVAGTSAQRAAFGQGLILGAGTTFPGDGNIALGGGTIIGNSASNSLLLGTDPGIVQNNSGRPIDLNSAAGGSVNIVGSTPRLGFATATGTTDPDLELDRTAAGVMRLTGDGTTAVFSIDDQGALRLLEEDAGGSNYLAFRAPSAVTSDQTCNLEDDASFIPDSCVGDGTDGGISGLGSTDNAIIRADGTGGSTAQGSALTIADTTGTISGPASFAIEFNGDTANTLTCTGGGCTIEGNAVKNAGKQTIPVTAGAMKANVTSPAACGDTYDSGSNDVTLVVCNFDTGATEERADFIIPLPKSYNGSTFTYQYGWSNTAGSAAQTVQLEVGCVFFRDDDTLNATLGTTVTQSDTFLATNDMHVSAESSALTCGGTYATGASAHFRVSRDTSVDNMTGDMALIFIRIFYTDNAANDN
jgi:hypothetical protein